MVEQQTQIAPFKPPQLPPSSTSTSTLYDKKGRSSCVLQNDHIVLDRRQNNQTNKTLQAPQSNPGSQFQQSVPRMSFDRPHSQGTLLGEELISPSVTPMIPSSHGYQLDFSSDAWALNDFAVCLNDYRPSSPDMNEHIHMALPVADQNHQTSFRPSSPIMEYYSPEQPSCDLHSRTKSINNNGIIDGQIMVDNNPKESTDTRLERDQQLGLLTSEQISQILDSLEKTGI